MMQNNFYITTPIYYPSGQPHMGHAYSSILADFFARFKRIQGFNVFFLTGTDEHGQKIQRAAKEKNKNPQLFCDEISENFRKLSKTLNLSNNDFIRTTEPRHLTSASHLWKILEHNKEIYLIMTLLELQSLDTWTQHLIFGKYLKIIMRFIYLNIQDGTQYQTKLFM